MYSGKLAYLSYLSKDHLPTYARWFRDYEVQRLLGQTALPITDEAEAAWFEHAVNASNEYHHPIHIIENDKLIGLCSLLNVDTRSRNAEYGISIGDKDSWNKGYGTDATSIMLRIAFDELNLHRVFLRVYDFNERAIRVYEKLGFVKEGVLRQHVFRDGKYHDVILMGLLRDEWQSK